jgi:two-component system LytT family sensor kinase
VPEAVQNAYVPSMILQPLIENAIRHGIACREDAGRIAIEGLRSGDDIQIIVRDDGAGVAESTHGAGTGLRNVDARLCELYGGASRVRVSANAGAFGAAVSLTIPYRSAPVADVAI